MTNKINIPREEIDKVIIFKREFRLKNAVKNEPNSSSNNNIKSKDSGKGFNTCGIIKPKTIKVIINTNEIKPKYLFIHNPPLAEIIYIFLLLIFQFYLSTFYSLFFTS